MALPASDTFTGVNGTHPPNANWTAIDGNMQIQGNEVCGYDNSDNACRWTADAFNSKHYSKLKFSANISSSGVAVGPAIRCQADANFFYAFRDGDGNEYVGQCIAGSCTDWEGFAGPAVGVVMELWVDATTETTIIYKEDGVTVKTYTSKNALSGGYAGICAYANHTGHRGDDWVGGDVGGAASVMPFFVAGRLGGDANRMMG